MRGSEPDTATNACAVSIASIKRTNHSAAASAVLNQAPVEQIMV